MGSLSAEGVGGRRQRRPEREGRSGSAQGPGARARSRRQNANMADILLVDDDNDLVEALADLLRAKGHDVHTAATGEEGLRVLRSASLPDALVLDVDMPVLGGPGMAHKMLLHDVGEEWIPI